MLLLGKKLYFCGVSIKRIDMETRIDKNKIFMTAARTVARLLVTVVILASCGGHKEPSQKPASRGLPYELAMVVPQALYSGELKDTLDAVLMGSTPLLPQHEPMFRLDVVYAEGNLTPWRTFRNRLIVEVDKALQRPEMGIALDAVARPQIEVKVCGPTAHDLAQFIGENRQRLTDLFVDHELDVEAANLRRKYSRVTADSLRHLADHTICVPVGLKSSKVGEDFLWTGTNLNDKDQNFIFYSYAWDGRPLTPVQFVAKRDSVLMVNIPGSRADQWMQTATEGEEPLVVSRTRVINKQCVQQVHGLWQLRNGALGGAFVAMERIDTAARRVLVTEGFIYSPHSPKRNLMRQMEAALRTFE